MAPLNVVAFAIVLGVSNAAIAKATPAQAGLLHELHDCRRAIASHTAGYVSPCAMREAGLLVGASRSDLLDSLGQPSFCVTTTNQIVPWSSLTCRSDFSFGYTFYLLGKDWIGGGPELWIQFDSAGAASSVRWVRTQ
jgi:hypothetical protein